MRHSCKFRVSRYSVVVDKEDSFVSELARRIQAAGKAGGKMGRPSMYRREIADTLAGASFVEQRFARPRPARLRPGRREAAEWSIEELAWEKGLSAIINTVTRAVDIRKRHTCRRHPNDILRASETAGEGKHEST